MLVKVITTKTVFGDKEKVLETVMKDKTREHFLYRVFGVIDAKQEGETARFQRLNKDTNAMEPSEWTKLFGDFAAINADNETFEGAALFLPGYVTGQFSEQLESGALGIHFAFDVFARYNKDVATSYEYIAAPVKRAGQESPLAKMASELAALPGGKAMPTIAAPAEPTPAPKDAVADPAKKK